MNQIRQVRERLGLSQKELAERIGVTQGAISHYEAAINNPSVATLKRMSAALHCTVDELLTGEKKKEENRVGNHSI